MKFNSSSALAGYIHETNTVFHTVPNAVHLQGAPCTQFSWFPGYAWQIAACSQCNGHLGWKFTVAAGNTANLVPKKFYGLAGGRILLRRYVKKHPAHAHEDGTDSYEEDNGEIDGERTTQATASDSENEHVDTDDDDEDMAANHADTDEEAGESFLMQSLLRRGI